MNPVSKPLFDPAPYPGIIPYDAGGIIAIIAAAAAVVVAVVIIIRARRKKKAASPGSISTKEEKP